MAIKIGDNVPNISLTCNEEHQVNLKDLKGKKIVLYFYPKDDTPGCTQEAKDFRDNLDKFLKLNTLVIGVSKDSIVKHQKFVDKYDLPFMLLSDEHGKLCEYFGVWVEKSMFGKKYMGIERSTFIIDENSQLVADWRKVKVKGHVENVLKVLNQI